MQEIGIALGAIAALVGLIALSVASGNLADIEVGPGSVVVRLRGLNKVWAVKNRIVIPIEAIRSVQVKRLEEMPLGLRLPGTSVPGLIVAGTYREEGSRSFYAIRRKNEVLELGLRDHPYDRIVIETATPRESADAIGAAIAP